MSERTKPAGLREFVRVLFADWFARMSGPLSVPAAVASLWLPNDIARILLGVTAFVCLWATAYVLWKRERDKRVGDDATKAALLNDISGLRVKLVRGAKVGAIRRLRSGA
jgi:hypothetical protein